MMMMSKSTTPASLFASGSTEGTKGIFTRMLESVEAAYQTRADRMVRPYLAQASVSDLAALGFTASEIAEIKRERHMPVVSWL